MYHIGNIEVIRQILELLAISVPIFCRLYRIEYLKVLYDVRDMYWYRPIFKLELPFLLIVRINMKIKDVISYDT